MQGMFPNGHGWSTTEKQAGWSLLDGSGSRSQGWLGGLLSKVTGGRRRRGYSLNLPSLPSSASASTVRFVALCCAWYMASAMSSNTGKVILSQFRYPVTLTFVQFGFIAGYSLLLMSPAIQVTKLRTPTPAIIRSTLPMAAFQVGGHIFSSVAISRIPVSTVHTIKALSPLFTVAAYAMLFGVRYSMKTYISLLPLTFGVMMASSADFSASNLVGLLSAFGSALIFVSSNIFFKKIMPSPSSHAGSATGPSHKLDKLNLLFYSSGFAFLLMIPVWIYYDLFALLSPTVAHPPHSSSPHGVMYYFFWNGAVHFGQNIIAFAILSTTSPVTYSIASLIKRIAVILMAIAWFNQTVHTLQAVGIAMTSLGLWMYNQSKGDVEKGEKKMMRVEAERQMMLPVTEEDRRIMDPAASPRISNEKPRSYPGLSITTGVQPNHISSPTYTHAQYAPPHHQPPSSMQIHPSKPMYNYRVSSGTSPVTKYPSPPPSLDSPTEEEQTFHAGFRPQRIVLAQRA